MMEQSQYYILLLSSYTNIVKMNSTNRHITWPPHIIVKHVQEISNTADQLACCCCTMQQTEA